MVVLNFTLTPANCVKLHDTLICLAKFSDSVSIEARHGQLVLATLNSSKSAYSSFVLDEHVFFASYEFVPDLRARDGRFVCCILNKALLSVFKGRQTDARGRETAIDRCEISVQDRHDRTECRFIIKMVCKHGVIKTYKLTFEPVEMMHAVFDKTIATNMWKIQSRRLREVTEFFGPKTEQLDIYYEDGRVTLTSYTEKVTNGKEILKQPLHTAVSIDVNDFEVFGAQEQLHIAISVKDFKNIIVHADTMGTIITARYSQPSRPLQFSYARDGMSCEFTVMTIGTSRDIATPHMSRSTTYERQETHASVPVISPGSGQGGNMRPPNPISSRLRHRPARALGKRASVSNVYSGTDADPDSLFLPVDDDDRQWEPAELRDDDEDILGWDASADNDVPLGSTFRDAKSGPPLPDYGSASNARDKGLAPTQRASQIRGLFDE